MSKTQPTIRARQLKRSPQHRAQVIERHAQERLDTDDSVIFRIGRFPVRYAPLLTLIILAAAALRFAGLDWGGAYYLHPDERYMVMVTTGIQWPKDPSTFFNTAVSTLNPYNNSFGGFLYGTFPVFFSKLVGTFLGYTVYGDAHLPGRWLSAIYDTGTVAMAAWAARMLYGRLAAIFAATMLAFCALMIETAHYYTTDAAVVFFTTCVLALSIRAWKTPSLGWYLLAGLTLGLAVASKPNALVAAGFVVIPALEHIRRHGWLALAPQRFPQSPAKQSSAKRRASKGLLLLVGTGIAAIVSAIVFRIFQPYAFTGPHIWDVRLNPDWTSALDYWSKAQAGVFDYPPGIQWANRPPVLFMVKNMVLWGMAPGFGLVALAAITLAVIRIGFSWRWPSWWSIGLAGFAWFHILYYGRNFVQSQRYILPAYPVMAILGGALLASLIAWARSGRPLRLGTRLSITLPKRWPKLIHPGYLIPILAVGITIFYGVAFTNIYLKPLTRVQASEWIYDNVPAGSSISSEYWDDALPLCMPEKDCTQYHGVQLYPYAEDDINKLTSLIGSLDQTDYVVLSSRRLIDSIGQMPYRWPMTTAYYRYLFDGTLGFELVAHFEEGPSIGPVAIDDSSSEESMTVYEHPQVYIFRKTETWNAHTAYAMLYANLQTGLGDDTGLVVPARADSPDLQLMDRADQRDYYNADSWRVIFNPSSWVNRGIFPAIVWYLAMQLLALPMIAILWRLFPGLPDRGYALAKTGALIATGYGAWLIASVRLLQWGPIPIAIAWGLLWIIAILCVGRQLRPFLRSQRAHGGWIIAAELIFLAAFAGAVWIRMQNPNLWNPWTGGEKPMDLAYFNATIRTPFFPPYDPWFRNGTIHYYYWGLVPWAMLTRLTGIVPTTAYNLAIPGVFALFLLNTWSVAAAFLSRLIPIRTIGAISPQRRFGGRIRIMALALIAPILTGILGNLQLLRIIGQGVWQGTLPIPADWPHWGAVTEIVWGGWQLVGKGVTLPVTSSYWDPTRAIPGTINEFPWFSFIFGDLHPHYTSLPLLTATIGAIAAFVFSIQPRVNPDRWKPASIFSTFGGWRPGLTVALVGGLLGGMLMASNSWDFPPAMALLCAAGFIIIGTTSGWSSGWTLLRDMTAFVGLAVVSSQLFWLPYVQHYGSLPSSVEAATETTTLGDFLSVNGVLLFAVASYLLLEVVRIVRPQLDRRDTAMVGAVFGLFAGVVCIVLALLSGQVILLLALMLAIVVLIAWFRQFDRTYLLLLAMIGLGLCLLLLPDVLRLQNDIGRMNTVFKFSYHAWVVLGIAGSVGLGLVFDAFQRRSLADAPAPVAPSEVQMAPRTQIVVVSQTPKERGWAQVGHMANIGWTIVLALLIAGAATYPALATIGRSRDVVTPIAPTLDGLAYMDATSVTYGNPAVTFSLEGDKAAVAWLNRHANGLPTILEAYDGEYHYGNRISAMTGLPTIVGWSAQERVQRPGLEPLVQNRIDDVQTIYGGYGDFASVRPILDRYGVQLIYVGGLERALYPAAALAKFDEGVTDGALKLVYNQKGVQIYVYDRSVPAPSNSQAVPPGTPTASPMASPAASPAIGSPDSSATASPFASPTATRPQPSADPSPSASPRSPETPSPTLTPVGELSPPEMNR